MANELAKLLADEYVLKNALKNMGIGKEQIVTLHKSIL
jgi:hypothetical protein